MDKKQYYRQSGIVFVLVGLIFLVTAIKQIFDLEVLTVVIAAIVIAAIAYAIVSSIMIRSKK